MFNGHLHNKYSSLLINAKTTRYKELGIMLSVFKVKNDSRLE